MFANKTRNTYIKIKRDLMKNMYKNKKNKDLALIKKSIQISEHAKVPTFSIK